MEVAAGAIRRDETVETVWLLAFAGGYVDAYTWIIHGVMANAETRPREGRARDPECSCLVVLLRCETPHREVVR
jgi:hypothetical protein